VGRYRKYGVTVFYTAPTAIRAFIKMGEHLLSELVFAAIAGNGGPINPGLDVVYHVIGVIAVNCGYLVANGNRRNYDYTTTGAISETRFCYSTLPWDSSGRCRFVKASRG